VQCFDDDGDFQAQIALIRSALASVEGRADISGYRDAPHDTRGAVTVEPATPAGPR